MMYVVSNLVEGYLENAWFVMLVEVLSAAAFACFWIGAYAYVEESSRPDVYITLFAILACLYYDVSGILVAFLGGCIYETWGGGTLFAVAGGVCAVWLLCLVVYHQGFRTWGRKKNDYAPLI